MLTDNESGMDLEEAHYYHVISDFKQLIKEHSVDSVVTEDTWVFNRLRDYFEMYFMDV